LAILNFLPSPKFQIALYNLSLVKLFPKHTTGNLVTVLIRPPSKKRTASSISSGCGRGQAGMRQVLTWEVMEKDYSGLWLRKEMGTLLEFSVIGKF